MKIREAPFALRIVRRRAGQAAVLYRRSLNEKHEERLTKVAAISPLAFTAGSTLLRAAVRAAEGPKARLTEGPYHPLDADWGARVACYGIAARGLRDGNRLYKAATHLRHADPAEAAWWLGLLRGGQAKRAVRALRILVEAVK